MFKLCNTHERIVPGDNKKLSDSLCLRAFVVKKAHHRGTKTRRVCAGTIAKKLQDA